MLVFGSGPTPRYFSELDPQCAYKRDVRMRPPPPLRLPLPPLSLNRPPIVAVLVLSVLRVPVFATHPSPASPSISPTLLVPMLYFRVI